MILVTGAKGVVGEPLCRELIRRGTPFRAVSRSARDEDNALKWDMELPFPMQRADAFSAMVHCAPLWLLPAHLEALYAQGMRALVVFSSTSIEGKQHSQSGLEQTIVQRLKHAEQTLIEFAAKHQLSLVILRPTLIYGYQRDDNVAQIARIIRRYGVFPLVGKASGLRQPIHADDLVTVALNALERGALEERGPIYNITGAETLSYRKMVERIFNTLGRRPRTVTVPLWLMRLGLAALGRLSGGRYTADMADRMNTDLVYDDEAARSAFDHHPRAFQPIRQVDV